MNKDKEPRLFYWEKSESYWCPVPDDLQPEQIGLSLEDMEEGSPVSVQFVRKDMTDEEFENIPEV